MDARQLQDEELRIAAGRKPSADSLAFVTQALSSKWEGTQALAIKALGAWRDPASIEAVRHFLEDAFNRKHGWAIRKVAINTLSEIVGPDDLDWVAALWRSREGELERYELRPLIERFPSLQRPFPWDGPK